ncbi:MAG: DUF86 domain-containing protein [Thermoanaerobaculia bacterium]
MLRSAVLLLEDIKKSCERIVHYTAGLTRDQVFVDEMRFDAVLFNLHIIGEAVKKLPLDLRERHSDIAWREIAGLRDFVAHAYFALDLDILWDAIRQDVPTLLLRVQEMIAQERPEG